MQLELLDGNSKMKLGAVARRELNNVATLQSTVKLLIGKDVSVEEIAEKVDSNGVLDLEKLNGRSDVGTGGDKGG